MEQSCENGVVEHKKKNKCWNACQVATELNGYGEFKLPFDLLNSHMKCISELSTWGKEGEAFVHLHLSPIVKFSALYVCTSMNTEKVPTGSTLCIQRNPRTRSKRNTIVSARSKTLLVASAQSWSNLLSSSLWSKKRHVQEDLEWNIGEVHFEGLLHLPILFFIPYF